MGYERPIALILIGYGCDRAQAIMEVEIIDKNWYFHPSDALIIPTKEELIISTGNLFHYGALQHKLTEMFKVLIINYLFFKRNNDSY